MNRSRVTGDLASHGNIFVDIANDRVGIGSTIPAHKLEVRGDTHIHGNLTLSNTAPVLKLVDTDNNSDFSIYGAAGVFNIYDETNSASRLTIASDGTITAIQGLVCSSTLTIPDSIIHSGDTNTKIRFPANDRISFETGGTQAAQIDSNQRLTIGTGGVGNASVYADDIVISGSGYRGMTIHTTTTSGNRAGCIFFGEGTSIPDYASGIIMFGHNGNYMHFSTGGSTNVGKSLRINSVGDVRFDSTPTSNHAMSVIIKSHKSRVVDDNNGICFLDGGDHTQAVINVQKKSASNASSDLVFRTSSGQVVNTLQGIPERLRITSAGSVKISNHGTNDLRSLAVLAPQSQIQFGTTVNVGGFLMSSSNGQFGLSGGGYWNGSNWVATHTASAQIRTDGDGDISFCTNTSLTSGNTFTPSETVTFKSDGKVGINQTVPTCQLQVDAGSSGAGTVTSS